MDLVIITTYRCNSRCSMCNIWRHPSLPAEEIGVETLAKIPGGFTNLNLTGGEPTLREDLPALVDLLYPKAHTFEISSNGLHSERLESIIARYPNIKVRFSLEGREKINDNIRGEEGGFALKVAGMRRLKALGGKDLGFATVIQDDNMEEIVELYKLACDLGVELSTSALHNAFQFHKSDNFPYNRRRVAKQVEGLIVEMLRSSSPKNWFRAYLNLGLIEKILGHDRLLPCTAGTNFIFVDPWGDVFACNVRPDLLVGNLHRQSWEEIINGEPLAEARRRVAACTQNCWMVATARNAMRNPLLPALPKAGPLKWVITNKLRVALGLPVHFERYIDYSKTAPDNQGPQREHQLHIRGVKRHLQRKDDEHYIHLGEYFNR